MKPLKQELEERGLLFQSTSDKIFEEFDNGGKNFYCGFDPTSDSLHLGNFIGFMVAVHLMRRGNKYTVLTGGATGMIGDPGGKDTERSFLSEERLERNQEAVFNQVTHVLKNLTTLTGEDFKYDFVNNKDFYTNMGYLDFLREVGKYITVNVMMGKDTVKKRIEDPKQSISYTEFSYMLVQGYDFAKMHKDNDMHAQIGGQDQWGNLVTGTEIIRKKYNGEAHVFTWPLITDATGKKFGKSEGNAMFLDKNKTSPYFIYQYFMNTADTDIGKYLKMLTLVDLEEIKKIEENHTVSPEKREGQKILAYKVIEIIHGKKEADLAVKITEFLFGNEDRLEILKTLKSDEITTFQHAIGGFKYSDENLFETIVKSGLAKSNSEARNSVKSGAIYINEEKIEDFNYNISESFINNTVVFMRKGRKNQRIIIK